MGNRFSYLIQGIEHGPWIDANVANRYTIRRKSGIATVVLIVRRGNVISDYRYAAHATIPHDAAMVLDSDGDVMTALILIRCASGGRWSVVNL